MPYLARSLQNAVLALITISCCCSAVAFGQETLSEFDELSRPVDVLIAEIEGDGARSQLKILLEQIREYKLGCVKCENTIKWAEANLPRRNGDDEVNAAKAGIDELQNAMQFALAEVQRLGTRTDSSWLHPIGQSYGWAVEPPLIEVRVTIRTSAGDAILPAKIALRSAASAFPIRFENGLAPLAGVGAGVDRRGPIDSVAGAKPRLPGVDWIRLASADERVETAPDNAEDEQQPRQDLPLGCVSRLSAPGKYKLGWQLSERSVVESCAVELKEPGLHLLNITIKRNGTHSTVELKQERLPARAITNPEPARQGLESPFENPDIKLNPNRKI